VVHGVAGRAHGGVRGAAGEVPPAEAFEVAEERGIAVPAAGLRRGAEEVEVVADEPDHPRRHEAVEELGAVDVVGRAAQGLADVVEERRGLEARVVGVRAGELKHLERVVEGVALRVIAGVLRDAVEGVEEVEEIVAHHRGVGQGEGGEKSAPSPQVHAHTHRPRSLW
jgi:hypothetical protein